MHPDCFDTLQFLSSYILSTSLPSSSTGSNLRCRFWWSHIHHCSILFSNFEECILACWCPSWLLQRSLFQLIALTVLHCLLLLSLCSHISNISYCSHFEGCVPFHPSFSTEISSVLQVMLLFRLKLLNFQINIAVLSLKCVEQPGREKRHCKLCETRYYQTLFVQWLVMALTDSWSMVNRVSSAIMPVQQVLVETISSIKSLDWKLVC